MITPSFFLGVILDGARREGEGEAAAAAAHAHLPVLHLQERLASLQHAVDELSAAAHGLARPSEPSSAARTGTAGGRGASAGVGSDATD